MESKKINQLATSVNPQTSDLTIIGDPITGVSKKISLLQIANLFATTGTVSSVAVTETGDALTITGSPITSTGTINIGFAGAANQYVRGDGALADFPTSTGGGSSVSYYLNSSVSQGTIGGVAYREFSKDPIAGAGTDITATTNGYIASYITDANDPALLEVPAGNFNCEFYFSVDSNAHNPYVYAELYKYDGSTFTLIGSSQSVPEYLTNGTTLSPYYFAIPVTQTALTLTDRIAIRIYANVDTREVTLHTENNHLCQVVTTFSKGLTSLNNLTRQVQFLATGTSGTDFNIVSSGDTHTFNLPIASATNTGKLSSTDWSTFNSKQPAGNYVTLDTTQTITAAKTFSLDILVNSLTIGRGAGAIASNTAIGISALSANTTGIRNIAIGENALLTNTTGFNNIAIGPNALSLNSTGLSNIAIGNRALENSTGGGGNTAVGSLSLSGITTGQGNIAIGLSAGFIITTGSNNTIIGSFAGTTTLSNNIVLADGAGNVRYRYDGTNNNLYGNVNFSSTIGNGTYTYTLPSATGTLALTSDLSAYLPLTGGTLTGNLTIAKSDTLNVLTLSSTNTNVISFITSSVQKGEISVNASNFQFNSATTNGYIFKNSAANNILTITDAGVTTLTGALSGTSATFSGNMAIGGTTITDANMLNVIGNQSSVNIGLVLNNTNATYPKIYAIQNVNNNLVFYDYSANATRLTISNTGAATFSSSVNIGGDLALTPTDSAIAFSSGAGRFFTGGNERMRITSGGNVGIGTSSPSTLLHLSSTSTQLTLQNTDGGGNAERVGMFMTGGDTFKLISLNDNNTTRVDNILVANVLNGNVGIGTSSPSYFLDVLSSSVSTARFKDSSRFCLVTIESSGTNQSTYLEFKPTGTGSAIFQVNGTDRMAITSGGNVGIGNTGATDVRLLIKAVDTTGSNYGLIVNNSSNANLLFVRNDGLILTGSQSASPYNLSTTGRSAVIESNGVLGYLVSTKESKANIKSIENVDFINQLNPVQFNYRKKDYKTNTFTDELYDNITYGFIADEVEQVNKELVMYNQDGSLGGVEYNSIIAILTKAVQDLTQKVNELESKNK